MKAETIHLRALEPEDMSFLYRWENDEQVWNVSNTITPYSKYILKKYIENSHLDIYETKQQRFIIVHTETKIPIGTIDLFDLDPHNLRIGIGILVYDENNRGKGYASQAIDLIIKYCFKVLDLHSIYCNITSDNIRSIGLFESKGFVLSGTKRDWLKISGRWVDEQFFQLLHK